MRIANTDETNAPGSLIADLWRFGNGEPFTIICAQLPAEMRAIIPYADPTSPDYIALYTYADLDTLFEIHGHVRFVNPASQVDLRAAGQLMPDDYTTHLVSLGGVDWNLATRSVLDHLRLPVEQVARDTTEGSYFEVDGGDGKVRHAPRLENSAERQVLREDVALFARATNPYNRERTVTICNGMYGSGTLGAVRALTDVRFRVRNAEYVETRFAHSDSFCILTRVTVENGVPLTPDWTIAKNRLFEWAS